MIVLAGVGLKLDAAKARATEAAIRFNRAFSVVQMPLWGEYWNVYAADRGFPPNATIAFTAQPPKTGLLF